LQAKSFLFGFVFTFLLCSSDGVSKPWKGIPLINNYSPQQYGNRGKIWDIDINRQGMAFFAADKGLLRFDGQNWDAFKGSRGFTRSLASKGDSLYYTGSDMDFGVWQRDSLRNWHYSSMYPFKDEVQPESEEFWGTYVLEDKVLFVSAQSLYIAQQDQLTKLRAPEKFLRSFMHEGSVYLSDSREGLFVFEANALRKIASFPYKQQLEIIGIYSGNNRQYVVTQGDGIFAIEDEAFVAVQNDLSQLIKESKAFSFCQLNDDQLAVGTILQGLYISSKDGVIQHHINRYKGLTSNTVLSLHYSEQQQLWMGLDYGLAMVDFSHPYTYVFDQEGNFGTAYSAALNGEELFVGTKQGLYKTPWKNLDNSIKSFSFELVPGSEGQVWKVLTIDGQVFFGHDKGLFTLKKEGIKQIGFEPGVWTFLQFKKYIFVGTYNGISVYERDGDSWSYLKQFDFIAGSCNQLLLQNDSVLWVNIPTYGLIRTKVDERFSAGERQIFAEEDFNGNDPYLVLDSAGIQLITDAFVYSFNEELLTFNQPQALNKQQKQQDALPPVFEPSVLDQHYVFYPVSNGFALRNTAQEQKTEAIPPSLILLRIEAMNNLESRPIVPGQKVPWKLNNLRFSFVVPNTSGVVYQYRLSDKMEWSDWSEEPELILLNLRHGKHKLWIRAKADGMLAEHAVINFEVGRPWYLSVVAFVVYLILLLLIIYAVRSWQLFRLRKQKKQLLLRQQASLRDQAEKHRQQINQLEQERLQEENETLKKQLKNKTIDLAAKARENDEKNKLLLSLKEKCDAVKEKPGSASGIWKEMQRMIESNLKMDDNTFDLQMNELHQEFFQKLKQNYPTLSNNDLRLCAYLKIGMNSKEIAELLNIQPSSSYISRSRLRKKLGISPEENLYDFLNGI